MLLNKLGGLAEPADVLKAPLLHLGDHKDWTRWLAQTRVVNPNPEAGIVFSDMNLVFAAASAGQGLAMGDELTCRTAMREGQLVRPFEEGVKSVRSYFLVMEHSKTVLPTVSTFANWIKSRLAKAEAVARNAYD